jgi:hypothetical protein
LVLGDGLGHDFCVGVDKVNTLIGKNDKIATRNASILLVAWRKVGTCTILKVSGMPLSLRNVDLPLKHQPWSVGAGVHIPMSTAEVTAAMQATAKTASAVFGIGSKPRGQRFAAVCLGECQCRQV